MDTSGRMGLVGFARPRASLSAKLHTGLSCGGGRERELEKRRYWDEHTGTRARRRLRTLKEANASYEGGQAEAADVAGARAFGHPRIK